MGILAELIGGNPATGEWVDRALCSQTDPDIFHPEGQHRTQTARRAKEVCYSCEVVAECRAWALERPEPDGVWGGLTPHERRRIRAQRRQDEEKKAAA
ncbi:MAG: WhiB family transcriptional regulator [Actinomycetota bacterium]|nr:WhiB family transcriptional regulator [Actinomycetota bacterium]